ncbi:hypothetical protein Tco_0695635 [Tanacetum coccineum]
MDSRMVLNRNVCMMSLIYLDVKEQHAVRTDEVLKGTAQEYESTAGANLSTAEVYESTAHSLFKMRVFIISLSIVLLAMTL